MENFDEKAIIERIRLLRRRYAGSRGKSKFAHALGISASTYSYYENSRIPPIETLLKICRLTSVDLEWLLTGSTGQKNSAFGPQSALLQKLNVLLAQNPDLSEPVLAFIELLSEKKGIEKQFHTGPSSASRPGWIPVLGRTAAGILHFWDQTILPQPHQAVTELDELVKEHIGKAIIASADATISLDLQARPLTDGVSSFEASVIQVAGGGPQQQIVQFVHSEQIFQLFPDSFALQIDGDSMSPRINDGDIVILSSSVPAAQGQIAIVRIANQIGVTCKLIRTTETDVHLIPINEKYDTKVVPKKDLLWSLAVLCHISF